MSNTKFIFVISGQFVLMAVFLLFEPPLLHMAYGINSTFLPPIVDPNDQPIKARIVVNGFFWLMLLLQTKSRQKDYRLEIK